MDLTRSVGTLLGRWQTAPRPPMIVVFLLSFVALGAGILVLRRGLARRRSEQQSIRQATARGEVVSLVVRDGRHGESLAYPCVAFVASNGLTIHFEGGTGYSSSGHLRPGAIVTVRYNSRNPNDAEIVADPGLAATALLLAGAVLTFVSTLAATAAVTYLLTA